jgi:hypothetical protein
MPVRPDRLVVPVQPGGNYPDIEPVKKNSDVQRGIEPIYQPKGGMCRKRGRQRALQAGSASRRRKRASLYQHPGCL